MKKILVLLLMTLFGYNCATVPVTGRKQLSLISNSELLPMSYDNYKGVLDSAKVSSNKEQADMVKRVGKKIQKAVEDFMAQNNASSHLDGYDWEFNLIDEDVAIAW